MQIANISLALGGDTGNVIQKYAVTAAEIAVLKAIHGDDAVSNVRPTGEVTISHRNERARLFDLYGRAMDGTQRSIVETLYPGAAARVFERLDELELDENAFAATGRASAETAAANMPQESREAPPATPAPVIATKPQKPLTPAQVKAAKVAETKAAKAEALAAKDAPPAPVAPPAAVEDNEAEADGIGDMSDEHAEDGKPLFS